MYTTVTVLMKKTVSILSVLSLFMLGLVLYPALSHATMDSVEGFESGHIIDDSKMYGENIARSMSDADIQKFLNVKGARCVKGSDGSPCIKNAKFKTASVPASKLCPNKYEGSASDTAAQIIGKTARACNINPQVLLVLLQKEQGLISTKYPTARKYRAATGFGCPDTAACSAQYAGFPQQIYNAASQLQRYKMYPSHFNFRAGGTYNIQYHPSRSCGTKRVKIENAATAALYNYTPYVPNQAALDRIQGGRCSAFGNRNFYLAYSVWFGRPNTPAAPMLTTKWVTAHGKNLKNPVTGKSFVAQGSTPAGWLFDKVEVSNAGKDKTYRYVPELTTKWLNADGKELKSTVKGKAFAPVAKFAGLLFVKSVVATDGRTTEHRYVPEVTTKWVDANDKSLQKAVSGKAFAKAAQFDGWALVKSTVSTDGRTTVHHYVPEVTTKWVDADGKELKATVKGKEFAPVAEFSGWLLEATTVSTDGRTTVHKYKPAQTIKWVDEKGEDLRKPYIHSVEEKLDLTKILEFDGKLFDRLESLADGKTQVYYYVPALTTKWVDNSGKELKTPVVAKKFADSIDFTLWFADGSALSEDGKTKIYKYQAITTTKWVDATGKDLQAPVLSVDTPTPTVLEKPKVFTGWVFDSVALSADGKTKLYKYLPELVTKWVDATGKDLQKAVQGEKFAPSADFTGWIFAKSVVSEDGRTTVHQYVPELTTKWLDTDGKVLKDTVTGKEFAVAGKAPTGWVFDKSEKSANGKEQIHYYKLAPKPEPKPTPKPVVNTNASASVADNVEAQAQMLDSLPREPAKVVKTRVTLWLDDKGNVLKPTLEGDEFGTPDDIAGYQLSDTDVSADGLITTYTYEKEEAPKLTAELNNEYVDATVTDAGEPNMVLILGVLALVSGAFVAFHLIRR